MHENGEAQELESQQLEAQELESEELTWVDERLLYNARVRDRRVIHTALKFWFACHHAPCRRHHKCLGDVDVCREIFWPVVPEEIKVWLRALADCRNEGLPVRKAHAIATEAIARFRRAQRFRAG